MDAEGKVSKYLSNNLITLRKRKGLSQDQLAKIAEIPRSTITHIESGLGNPSLHNMVRLSNALQISIEEMLSRPRNECELRTQDQITVLKKNQGTVRIYKLLPDKTKGLDVDRMEFDKGASMGGQPHLVGAKEYLTVINGEVTVQVAGNKYKVEAGSVFAFPGDQAHAYQATGGKAAMAISIVVPITLGID